MDHEWTPKSSRPSTLYRVYYPRAHTKHSQRAGFVASADLETAFIPYTQYTAFINSIASHRNQTLIPSPYISLFADKTEAGSWAIGAEDVYEEECYVLEINVDHKSMEKVIMWSVQDIQEQSSYRYGNPPLGGMSNSEWLVLGAIPPQAIKISFQSSTSIRRKRSWKNDNLDAAYIPTQLPDRQRISETGIGPVLHIS